MITIDIKAKTRCRHRLMLANNDSLLYCERGYQFTLRKILGEHIHNVPEFLLDITLNVVSVKRYNNAAEIVANEI